MGVSAYKLGLLWPAGIYAAYDVWRVLLLLLLLLLPQQVIPCFMMAAIAHPYTSHWLVFRVR
jgi:hypothetical protein